MNQLGLEVIIRTLVGRDGSDGEALEVARGQTITRAWLDDEANDGDGALRIALSKGGTLTLVDDGRTCCESRYMTCDDDLATFTGAALLDVEVRQGPNVPDEYEEHETMFVHVITDKGTIVVTTHNEHNGYYGGFWPRLTLAAG